MLEAIGRWGRTRLALRSQDLGSPFGKVLGGRSFGVVI